MKGRLIELLTLINWLNVLYDPVLQCPTKDELIVTNLYGTLQIFIYRP